MGNSCTFCDEPGQAQAIIGFEGKTYIARLCSLHKDMARSASKDELVFLMAHTPAENFVTPLRDPHDH